MDEGVQKGVKHSLSSSSAKLPPAKRWSRPITDPENVKENTEVIFKFLLKDCYEERVMSQVSTDNEDETPPSLSSQDSFGLDLDLPTDIVSDSISTTDDDEQEATIKKIAQRLGEIGDDVQKLYEGKPDFQQSLISCAQKATTESIYQSFEKSLDTFLEDQKKYLPDASDQYQVALIFLCTKTALTLASPSITEASNSADIVISHAVNFVSNHFPRWLGGIQ